jgi:uncharacterized protein YaaR (DUF327 family)
MSNSIALENFEIDKENFESYMDFEVELTNKQWHDIIEDINNRVADLVEGVLKNIAADVKDGYYD